MGLILIESSWFEEISVIYGEVCFSQKMFTNGRNMSQNKPDSKIQSVNWKYNEFLVKCSARSKEGHADSFLGLKRVVTIDFLEKDATVNSVSYWQNSYWQNSPYLLN